MEMKLLLAYVLFFVQITASTIVIPSQQSAHAQAIFCRGPMTGSPVPASVSSWATIGDSAFMSAAWACVVGIFKGAWEATGGVVVGVGECVWSPIECAEGAKKAFNNAYNFFQDVTKSFNKVFDTISNMSTQDKADLICSIIGGVGIDVLIAVLTVGAGSAKVAATLGKLGVKIAILAELLKRFTGLPMRILGKLSDATIDKIKLLMNLGYKDDIVRSMAKCAL